MAKKIFWDAGHGGSDPGAVGYVRESDVNVAVTNYGCAYLEANYVCNVYKDISADSINTVVGRANKWGADLFISTHFNADGGDGYEALVYDANNAALGQCFERHVKAIGQNSRGVKYRPDLGVLRLTNMKAILNECAFVDNWNDIKDWNDAAELKVMGEALAKAAAEWLGLQKKKTARGVSNGGGYVAGRIYALQDHMNVRTGPGTNYPIKQVSELTADGKRHATRSTGAATLRKGTEVTCLEVYGDWMRIPSGWVCCRQGNEVYIA